LVKGSVAFIGQRRFAFRTPSVRGLCYFKVSKSFGPLGAASLYAPGSTRAVRRRLRKPAIWLLRTRTDGHAIGHRLGTLGWLQPTGTPCPCPGRTEAGGATAASPGGNASLTGSYAPGIERRAAVERQRLRTHIPFRQPSEDGKHPLDCRRAASRRQVERDSRHWHAVRVVRSQAIRPRTDSPHPLRHTPTAARPIATIEQPRSGKSAVLRHLLTLTQIFNLRLRTDGHAPWGAMRAPARRYSA
jgi:hypothetical protein